MPTLNRRWAPPHPLQRGLAVLMVVLSCVIAVTGSVVRVTSSGLGCPTWPRCTRASLVPVHDPTTDMVNTWIEFGNRMLSGVVGVVAVLVVLAAVLALPRRRRQITLAVGILVGVAAEAVIGGLTVLGGLNWWLVCVHFLVTPALVWVSVVHLRAVGEGDGPPEPVVPQPIRSMLVGQAVLMTLVLVAGTLVTAAGPHSGGIAVPRLGVPIPVLVTVHGGLLVVFLATLVATGFRLAAAHPPRALWRSYGVVVGLVVVQAVLGVAQYELGVPQVLVACHVALAMAVVATDAWLCMSSRTRAAATPEQLPAPAVTG